MKKEEIQSDDYADFDGKDYCGACDHKDILISGLCPACYYTEGGGYYGDEPNTY